MIKPNELRIGNWVLVNNHPIQVTDVSEEGINREPKGKDGYRERWLINFGMIEPMPLTFELLIASGFEKDNKRQPFDQSRYYHPSNMLFDVVTKYPSGRFLAIRYVSDDAAIIIKERLDCLHELQNLYFAMTGQELQIKEPQILAGSSQD